MAASAALASLLLLLANGTSNFDCVCSCLHDEWGSTTEELRYASVGERFMWSHFCALTTYELAERCETLVNSSAMLATLYRLRPWGWQYGPPPAEYRLGCALEGECDCDAALADLLQLTYEDARELVCRLTDTITKHHSSQRLNDTKWTAMMLESDHLRQPKLSQLLNAARGTRRAMTLTEDCVELFIWWITGQSQAELSFALELYSDFWRRIAPLFTVLRTQLSQLFIPLAFELVGNHTNGQQLPGSIKKMERVRDMLDTKLRGFVHDLQFLSEEISKYKVEENLDRPGTYKIRRPLLREGLMEYHSRFSTLRDDFGALCEQQLPYASQVFGLADWLYYFYRVFITLDRRIENANFTDVGWELEDQSNTTVWVDTGCLQLLAAGMDRPRCPLEELPLEASRQRRQCRERLWRDLVERPPRPPVTSYLAYNERADVSLCLLAWMATNSYGVCQDVPFSITRSVHDAACYFETPGNQTCLQSNTADAICSVSRAVLLLKCRDFSSANIPNVCRVKFTRTGNYSEITPLEFFRDYYTVYGKATEMTLSYKESLNSVTFKYRDFKVDVLKPLEYSFIGVNVLFRLWTASVYMWLPHLGNLPGKILLSYQLTGMAQVLCSEVLYRMVGFPDLSTAALVDSSLTLLGCLWLNTFSFQMYVCVRDLRLPDHLTPAEASILFRRQLRWALIPWALLSTTCAALEKSSRHYLLYSRITLTVAISSSIALNLFLLGSVAFIYIRNKKSMRGQNIIGGDKGFSKKQLTFMSVNTIILSGICVIIRIGFQQSKGLAQYVYYVHIATMLQGPVLFIFLLCNKKTLPALRNKVLALWRPEVYRTGLELGSVARRNLSRRRGEPPRVAETAL